VVYRLRGTTQLEDRYHRRQQVVNVGHSVGRGQVVGHDHRVGHRQVVVRGQVVDHGHRVGHRQVEARGQVVGRGQTVGRGRVGAYHALLLGRSFSPPMVGDHRQGTSPMVAGHR